MNQKGFEADITLEETPNFKVTEEKPLKAKGTQHLKVDINVLKARVQEYKIKKIRKMSLFSFFF